MPEKKLQGFALMKLKDPERLKDVAARAGRQSWKQRKGHRFTREEAKEAGRKGGLRRWKGKKA